MQIMSFSLRSVEASCVLTHDLKVQPSISASSQHSLFAAMGNASSSRIPAPQAAAMQVASEAAASAAAAARDGEARHRSIQASDVLCSSGHHCVRRHYVIDGPAFFCNECHSRLRDTEGFQCVMCNYDRCSLCSPTVANAAVAAAGNPKVPEPIFCLDLPAYVASCNIAAMSLFPSMLRRHCLAAHPPALPPRSMLLYASSASASSRPMQLTARARLRVHSCGLTMVLILRLLHSSTAIPVGRMRTFARSMLRRLSGNGCSIVQVLFYLLFPPSIS
jgi:hypothetical protein